MNEQEAFPTVIVRGYGGEPAVLTVHRVNQESRYVYVAKPWAKRAIGFLLADVFEYDDWCFTKLKRAYDANDKVKLAELYQEAIPFRIAADAEPTTRPDPSCAVCGQNIVLKEVARTSGKTYHLNCLKEIGVI